MKVELMIQIIVLVYAVGIGTLFIYDRYLKNKKVKR